MRGSLDRRGVDDRANPACDRHFRQGDRETAVGEVVRRPMTRPSADQRPSAGTRRGRLSAPASTGRGGRALFAVRDKSPATRSDRAIPGFPRSASIALASPGGTRARPPWRRPPVTRRADRRRRRNPRSAWSRCRATRCRRRWESQSAREASPLIPLEAADEWPHRRRLLRIAESQVVGERERAAPTEMRLRQASATAWRPGLNRIGLAITLQ